MAFILKIPTKVNGMKPDTLSLLFNLLQNIPYGRFKQIRSLNFNGTQTSGEY
jgi:hypothetical protein